VRLAFSVAARSERIMHVFTQSGSTIIAVLTLGDFPIERFRNASSQMADICNWMTFYVELDFRTATSET
jgi:hypothetical protein